MKRATVLSVINESGIAFGTSGARGLVTDFTSDVTAAFTIAFLQVMKKSYSFQRLALAIDNRPSSPTIASACISAAKAVGIEVDYYGVIPTPALALTSMAEQVPAIMVTGSHIPFDRNGLKFYRPDGEITKQDEAAILSVNSAMPLFKIINLPQVSNQATNRYISRYVDFFGEELLEGKRIGIYEHSSSGRDIYARLFKLLGASVISLGRSDNFIPIDTEAVAISDIEMAQRWQTEHKLDAVFSTDGDGDRPLLSDETGSYLRGDILCLLAAKSLKIEALAVPVSCNSGIEKSEYFKQVIRTRIGSPHVIDAFEKLGADFNCFAGFEANGGFLLGSNLKSPKGILNALPTRDAVLPAIAALAMTRNIPMSCLVDNLPNVFTASDRIQNFPLQSSLAIIEQGLKDSKSLLNTLGLEGEEAVTIDITDGLRITLSSQEVIHLRPSGNAPELRCYAEAGSSKRALAMVANSLSALRNLR